MNIVMRGGEPLDSHMFILTQSARVFLSLHRRPRITRVGWREENRTAEGGKNLLRSVIPETAEYLHVSIEREPRADRAIVVVLHVGKSACHRSFRPAGVTATNHPFEVSTSHARQPGRLEILGAFVPRVKTIGKLNETTVDTAYATREVGSLVGQFDDHVATP